MISESRLDELFLLCDKEAQKSPDSETKVGCAWIRYENNWSSTDFFAHNSSIRETRNLPTTRPDKYEYMIHAEQNLLTKFANSSYESGDGVVIVTLSPCITCCRLLYQAGIRRIYFRDEYREFQSQLNARDLKFNLTTVGKYTRIELEVRNE